MNKDQLVRTAEAMVAAGKGIVRRSGGKSVNASRRSSRVNRRNTP